MAKTATKTSTKRSTKSVKKAGAVRTSKPCDTAADAPAGNDEVSIDRRHPSERRGDEAESGMATAGPTLERRQKVNRRRQIDPTTCERDYTDQEVEFMNALDEYKRKSGRMFPTCSEVLEVINSLGYVKLSPSQMMNGQAGSSVPASAKPMPSNLQVEASLAAVIAATEQLA